MGHFLFVKVVTVTVEVQLTKQLPNAFISHLQLVGFSKQTLAERSYLQPEIVLSSRSLSSTRAFLSAIGAYVLFSNSQSHSGLLELAGVLAPPELLCWPSSSPFQ